MNGYACEHCPLAFEVGYNPFGDALGVTMQYVCRHCGTMHKTVHSGNEPDQFFAIDGPIPAMEVETLNLYDGTTHQTRSLPINEDSWRFIATLPTDEKYLSNTVTSWERVQAVKLCNLACTHCLRAGGLVSSEWPQALNGTCPAFGDRCPLCAGAFNFGYVTT